MHVSINGSTKSTKRRQRGRKRKAEHCPLKKITLVYGVLITPVSAVQFIFYPDFQILDSHLMLRLSVRTLSFPLMVCTRDILRVGSIRGAQWRRSMGELCRPHMRQWEHSRWFLRRPWRMYQRQWRGMSRRVLCYSLQT